MINFKEKLKWKRLSKPLEERLRDYKHIKRMRESVIYTFDYDMEYKGYGKDNIYRSSFILYKDCEEHRLVFAITDRAFKYRPDYSHAWSYTFDNDFIYSILADTRRDFWCFEGGHGMPMKLMKQVIREMKESCRKNRILICDSYGYTTYERNDEEAKIMYLSSVKCSE